MYTKVASIESRNIIASVYWMLFIIVVLLLGEGPVGA